jgi:hypothetical protein
MLAVCFIAVTVLLAALPVFLRLVRESKTLGREALTKDGLPFLLDRIHKDLTSAAYGTGGFDTESMTLTISLEGATKEEPAIDYEITPKKVTRTEKPGRGMRGEPARRVWEVKGKLILLPEALAGRQIWFVYAPERGGAEFAAFALPKEAPPQESTGTTEGTIEGTTEETPQ